MITYLKGKFTETEPTHVVVDIQGMGYHVHITLNTFSDIKGRPEGLLYTHFHVKEDQRVVEGTGLIESKI